MSLLSSVDMEKVSGCKDYITSDFTVKEGDIVTFILKVRQFEICAYIKKRKVNRILPNFLLLKKLKHLITANTKSNNKTKKTKYDKIFMND